MCGLVCDLQQARNCRGKQTGTEKERESSGGEGKDGKGRGKKEPAEGKNKSWPSPLHAKCVCAPLGALGSLAQSATATRELWLGASGRQAAWVRGWQRLEVVEANRWIWHRDLVTEV